MWREMIVEILPRSQRKRGVRVKNGDQGIED
jgi:hypothetical protein